MIKGSASVAADRSRSVRIESLLTHPHSRVAVAVVGAELLLGELGRRHIIARRDHLLVTFTTGGSVRPCNCIVVHLTGLVLVVGCAHL